MNKARIVDDLSTAWFGDPRLTKRMVKASRALSARPSRSFPKTFLSSADLEGAYRFVNNRRVTPDEILVPHHAATAARADEQQLVIVIHDTTEIRYSGSETREGLGPLHGHDQGFLAHVSLAVTANERVPLGVLAMSTWTRSGKKAKKSVRQNSGRRGEFCRWEDQALECDARLSSQTRAIHVMDREADAYSLFCALTPTRFVVRTRTDRKVIGDDGLLENLREVAAKAPVILEREVLLSARPPSRRQPTATKKRHPVRKSRMARLGVSASAILLRRTKAMPRDLPSTHPIHLVRVFESDTPKGDTPVEWLLATNLPIDTPEQLAEIVDAYRARWTIEEYFKALKTGCQLEARQLESLHALLNATALFVPIACQMLALRTLDRAAPKRAASRALTATQISILRALPELRLSKSPTVGEALLAIARIGGHLRHNGPPGWQTLADGFAQLQWLELGWNARKSCDQ